MNTKGRLAWHVVGEQLRDGAPVPEDLEPITVEGKCALCHRGLHASPTPLAAVSYTPGWGTGKPQAICRVWMTDVVEVDYLSDASHDKMVGHQDKMVGHQRTILYRVPWSVAVEWGKLCALDAVLERPQDIVPVNDGWGYEDWKIGDILAALLDGAPLPAGFTHRNATRDAVIAARTGDPRWAASSARNALSSSEKDWSRLVRFQNARLERMIEEARTK